MTTKTLSWCSVVAMPPPEGKLVRTISHTGKEQKLRRYGSLWFLEDNKMYVYYVPEFWCDL